MAENALAGRIKALIGFRAIFVTLLLGSSFAFKIVYFSAHPRAISYYIIALYVLTIVYAILFTRLSLRRLTAFAYVQLVLDVFSEIMLLYITGGVESWFSFTFILTILSSSIVLDRRAGFVMASISGILYGMLLNLQFYRVLPLQYETMVSEKEFLYNAFIHVLSFFLTAFLSGHLSSRLEKTVRKLEEKDASLRDLELFNREVIQSLPSGLITTDTEGRVVIFNRAAERITGRSRDEVLGFRIPDVFPFLGEAFKEGRFEGILQTAAGEKRIIGMNISLFKDVGGNEAGYIGVFQDLTQVKELEEEVKKKEKWATIGELSANIAHEIRNPLASMRSSIEMLREETIPQKHRTRLMEIALSEMGRLNAIVTDFLAYSSPKSLDVQRTDIHLLLDETLALLRSVALERGNVEIRKKFEGDLHLYADPQKIKQVFWNLGVNAMEAMQSGGVLDVSTRLNNTSAFISFSDTGSGISAAEIDKIFFPFYTTKASGTGLGLSIAYKIVEEHEGRLTVRSEPGIGTTFEIILDREDGRRKRENPHH